MRGGDDVPDPELLGCTDDADLRSPKARIVARKEEQPLAARECRLEEVWVAQICLKPGDVR